MLTPEQIKERLNGIGASDAPIITGHSTFSTAYQLYKEKRGELEPKEAGPKADAGNFLESGIAALFTHKTGIKTFLAPDTIYHPEHKVLFTHLDRTFNDGIPLEIKNTTQADLWGPEEDSIDGIPLPVYIQVLHQLACTGKNMAVVACLLFGYDLRIYEIPRDDELIEMIIAKCLKFWKCVQDGVPPPIQFNHSTTQDLLRRCYPGTNAQIKDLSDNAMIWHKERTEALEFEKHYKKIADEKKAIIMDEMGEFAIGRLSDGTSYQRKANKKGAVSMTHSKYTPVE